MLNTDTIERAYSNASYHAEGIEIMLNVSIATPPFDRAANGWMKVNPGIASSYIFSRKKGDKVTISGPYGEFFINPSDAEMLYVGGGAGMAPMRSHLYHLFKTLKTGRKVTYWYGGRSKRELFYLDHFFQLEKDFPNFNFFLVLSEPLPEDNWKVKKDIHDKEGEVDIDFWLKQSSNNWFVVDVILDGISMRNNLRSQFYKILKKNDFNELVRRMEKKLKGAQG